MSKAVLLRVPDPKQPAKLATVRLLRSFKYSQARQEARSSGSSYAEACQIILNSGEKLGLRLDSSPGLAGRHRLGGFRMASTAHCGFPEYRVDIVGECGVACLVVFVISRHGAFYLADTIRPPQLEAKLYTALLKLETDQEACDCLDCRLRRNRNK